VGGFFTHYPTYSQAYVIQSPWNKAFRDILKLKQEQKGKLNLTTKFTSE
jgi:hypothetical protein